MNYLVSISSSMLMLPIFCIKHSLNITENLIKAEEDLTIFSLVWLPSKMVINFPSSPYSHSCPSPLRLMVDYFSVPIILSIILLDFYFLNLIYLLFCLFIESQWLGLALSLFMLLIEIASFPIDSSFRAIGTFNS